MRAIKIMHGHIDHRSLKDLCAKPVLAASKQFLSTVVFNGEGFHLLRQTPETEMRWRVINGLVEFLLTDPEELDSVLHGNFR
jgi:hypothetical protein